MFGMMNQMDRMMNQMFQDPFFGMPVRPGCKQCTLWQAVPQPSTAVADTSLHAVSCRHSVSHHQRTSSILKQHHVSRKCHTKLQQAPGMEAEQQHLALL